MKELIAFLFPLSVLIVFPFVVVVFLRRWRAERRRQEMICWPRTQAQLSPDAAQRTWTDTAADPAPAVRTTRTYTYYAGGKRVANDRLLPVLNDWAPVDDCRQLLEGFGDRRPLLVHPDKDFETYLALPSAVLDWWWIGLLLAVGVLPPLLVGRLTRWTYGNLPAELDRLAVGWGVLLIVLAIGWWWVATRRRRIIVPSGCLPENRST